MTKNNDAGSRKDTDFDSENQRIADAFFNLER